jgi:hypothetical protein
VGSRVSGLDRLWCLSGIAAVRPILITCKERAGAICSGSLFAVTGYRPSASVPVALASVMLLCPNSLENTVPFSYCSRSRFAARSTMGRLVPATDRSSTQRYTPASASNCRLTPKLAAVPESSACGGIQKGSRAAACWSSSLAAMAIDEPSRWYNIFGGGTGRTSPRRPVRHRKETSVLATRWRLSLSGHLPLSVPRVSRCRVE